MRKGLWLAKTYHVVPLKILNPTDEVVSIPKGSILSDFHLLNKDYDIVMDNDKTCKTSPVKDVNNVFSEQTHGGYPLRIYFDQICVPYCFPLTQRTFVAQMDVSLQGSDENSTKGDHLRYSLFYFII